MKISDDAAAEAEHGKLESKADTMILDEYFQLKPYKANRWDVLMLGITTVLGGEYYGWTAAFESGFGSVSIGQFLMGIAYIAMMLCFAEMVSALPLKGNK